MPSHKVSACLVERFLRISIGVLEVELMDVDLGQGPLTQSSGSRQKLLSVILDKITRPNELEFSSEMK